jgi:hypothetical protein
MLNFVVLNVIMISGVRLSVVINSDVMLNVVVPSKQSPLFHFYRV